MSFRRSPLSVEVLEQRTFLSAGQLDPSFGAGGVVTFDPTEQREGISLFARTTGGKLLIAGTDVNFRDEPYVVRLNADGSPDESFGPAGKKSVALPGGAFAVDSTSGRILIASQGEVTAYNADFTIDTSFGGGDGVIDVGEVTIRTVRLVAGGRIVIAGPGSTGPGESSLFVFRFTADGTPDTSFGGGHGEAVIEATSGQAFLEDLEVASDGSIFVAARDEFHGGSAEFGDVDIVNLWVYKLTEGGEIDNDFAGDGSVFLGSRDFELNIRDLDLAADDTPIVFWSSPQGPDETAYHLSRISATGELQTLPPLTVTSPFTSVQGIALDSQGRILALGSLFNEETLGGSAPFATRFLPDGTVDATFGTFGVFVDQHTFTRNSRSWIVTTQGDAIMAEAHGDTPFTTVNAVLRVMKLQGGEGAAPDVAVNADGDVVVTTTQTDDEIRVHRRRSDGRIVVRVGDFARSLPPRHVKRIVINALGGDDSITFVGNVPAGQVDGGDGRDTINGGDGDDVLLGGLGKDRIFGGAGDDLIKGGGGNDYLLGNSGGDTILGQGGRDRVRGAGGNDNLFGGAGDDSLAGGLGNDRGASDPLDTRDEIEMLL